MMPVNRRGFLATGLAAGWLTHWEIEVTAADNLDPTNLTKSNVPTPALLVDLDAFESNVKSMAEHCRKSGRGFRPHAKTHKCPEVAKRQMSGGSTLVAFEISGGKAVPPTNLLIHPTCGRYVLELTAYIFKKLYGHPFTGNY